MSFDADKAAASTFSPIIRRYSAGEHWFCAISIARRVMVSQDASIISAIIVETESPRFKTRLMGAWRDAARRLCR
jgi:hypothetical protein